MHYDVFSGNLHISAHFINQRKASTSVLVCESAVNNPSGSIIFTASNIRD